MKTPGTVLFFIFSSWASAASCQTDWLISLLTKLRRDESANDKWCFLSFTSSTIYMAYTVSAGFDLFF